MDLDFPTRDRWAPILIAAAMYSNPVWAEGPTVSFHIPAGYAAQTLSEFYRQSQVRVLYLADTVKGVQTQAVRGELQASEALARMLEGTGLSYEFDSEYSALIKIEANVSAAAQAAATPDAPGEGPSIPQPPGSEPRVEQVLVTGSLIHGVLDIMSPLVPLEREEIKRTPYATVQDAVWALPLAATITRGEVLAGVGNYNLGSAINLRGLGDGATLVLVNGRRQPVGGERGDFVDVANLPWSMVERIEVLPDGGSALYGSDAIAGVVNIIMRRELEGAETQLRVGSAHGGAAELLVSQLVGDRWDSGGWLAGYQYSQRTSLSAADRDFAGNADKRLQGGSDYRSANSNPGNILDPQTLQPAFAIPHGQDGTLLSPADLLPSVVNYSNRFTDSELLPNRQMHNLYFTASQYLSERVELFAEGRYAQRDTRMQPIVPDAGSSLLLTVPATNPFFVDPFGGFPFVIVAYDLASELGPVRNHGRTRTYLGTLGLEAEFNDDWRALLSASHGAEDLRSTGYGAANPFALSAALADSDPATAFNPFGDGSYTNPATIDAIRMVAWRTARSEIFSAQLTADGPLVNLPAGTAKAAVGFEYREESLRQNNRIEHFDLIPSRLRVGRRISAVFAELSAPLIGNPDDPYAPPRVELSLAGRYERYDDFGNTFNPKIGLRWAPLTSVKLRASWGTSFRAPNLVDLNDSLNTASLVTLPDPTSSTGLSTILGLQGGNPDLKEERATTWTAGLDLAPQALPGFQFSLTAYSIDYENQVVQPGPANPFEFLLQEGQWASVITRNPSQSQIDRICASPQFVGAPPSECSTNPPNVIIDIRKQNLAITRLEGVDLMLNQSFVTDWGHLDFEVNGTHVFHFKRAFTQAAPMLDVLDTVNNPLALRVRGTVEWQQRGKHQTGFGANLTVNHTGGYRDLDSPVRRSVDAWTTLDLGLSYRTPSGSDWTNDAEFVVNVTNVSNQDPPFVDREWGFDVFNAQPFGRVFSAYISKRW